MVFFNWIFFLIKIDIQPGIVVNLLVVEEVVVVSEIVVDVVVVAEVVVVVDGIE